MMNVLRKQVSSKLLRLLDAQPSPQQLMVSSTSPGAASAAGYLGAGFVPQSPLLPPPPPIPVLAQQVNWQKAAAAEGGVAGNLHVDDATEDNVSKVGSKDILT
jgi:hypothetical protein